MCPPLLPELESEVPVPPRKLGTALPDRTNESRTALSHQQDLEDTLSYFLKDIQSGHRSRTGVEKAIVAAQKHAAGLKSFLSDCIDPKLYNERRPDASTSARRTFDVAELLEMILDNLEIPAIVNRSQVSRSLKESIEASTKIQDKLSLRATPRGTHPYTAFEECLFRDGGFRCVLESDRQIPDMYALRVYFFPFPGERLPRIGSTYRRMFICQPPITQMSVHHFCCSSMWELDRPPKDEVRMVSSEDGLTIGHLYDFAKKLMDEH